MFDLSKNYITSFFKASRIKIWTRNDLVNILSEMRETWDLPCNYTINEFICFLINETSMIKISLNFIYKPSIRYCWKMPNSFELLQSCYPEAYLSHATAMYIHGITEAEPSILFINIEQSDKYVAYSNLEQGRIDAAFKKSPRVSNNITTVINREICQLSGKYTNQLGVIDSINTLYGNLKITNLSRTLIDISVRPTYGGGTCSVLNAYRAAIKVGKIDLDEIYSF